MKRFPYSFAALALVLAISSHAQTQNPTVTWPGLRTDPSSLRELERRTFDFVNQQRAKERLPALAWAEDLSAIARFHSGDMAE